MVEESTQGKWVNLLNLDSLHFFFMTVTSKNSYESHSLEKNAHKHLKGKYKGFNSTKYLRALQ